MSASLFKKQVRTIKCKNHILMNKVNRLILNYSKDGEVLRNTY
jgi:hypothetical protein